MMSTRLRLVAGLSVIVCSLCGAPAGAAASDEAQPSPPANAKSRSHVTVYPLLVQAPIFGATVNLPSRPGSGGGGGEAEESASTDLSVNGAWAYGVLVQADRWFAEFNGLWADVSAERIAPRVNVDTDTRLYSARAGVRLVGGLSATGGVRRLSSDLQFSLTGGSTTYTAQTKPVLWDPLVGADWRSEKGPFRFDASFEGGGFGVGTDKEYAADVHVDWQFVPHVVLRAGYSFFYYKMTIADVTVNSISRTLVSTQSLNGPALGIGFTF
jgi:hypothetical protein